MLAKIALSYSPYMTDFLGSYYSIVPLIICIFSIVVGVRSFSIFHNKRSVDLFLSLPTKRRTLFLARYVSGLTVMLVPLFFVTLLGGLLGGDVLLAIGKFLATMPSVLACFTMFAFLAGCCGTATDTVVSFISINFAYPCCYFIINMLMLDVSPGYSVGYDNGILLSGLLSTSSISTIGVSILSPMLGTFISGNDIVFTNYSLGNNTNVEDIMGFNYLQEGGSLFGIDILTLTHIIYWLVFTAVILAVTLVIFKCRKNENVQSSFIYELPKVLIIFISSVGCGFLCTYLGMDIFGIGIENAFKRLLWAIAWSVIGCFIAYLVVTCIYNRGGLGFVKTLTIFLTSVVVVVLVYFLVATGVFKTSDQVPDVSEIGAVQVCTEVSEFSEDYVYDDATIQKTVALHKVLVEEYYNNKKFLQTPNIFNDGIDGFVLINYTLKNGSVITKVFYAASYDTDKISVLLDDIYSSKEYKEANFSVTNYDEDMCTNIMFDSSVDDVDGLYMYTAEFENEGSENQKTNKVQNVELAKEFIEAYRDDIMNDTQLYTNMSECDIYAYLIITYSNISDYYNETEYMVIPKNGYDKTKAVIQKYSKEFEGYDTVIMCTYDNAQLPIA